MNTTPAVFRQDIAKHLDGIKRLCRRWGVPRLGEKVTLILRDPENDNMSFLLTDETDVKDIVRIVRYLDTKGV